jgi:hypothetical protein
MNIQIDCPCGLHYEFEVEPVNERMPMPVSCPECGADGTEQANAMILQQLAPATPEPAARLIPNPQALIPIVAAAAIVLAGLWGFYRFYVSKPRTSYSQKIPKAEQAIAYRMISPTEIFSANAKQVGIFDLKQRKQRWTADFKAPAFRFNDSEPDDDTEEDKSANEPDTPSKISKPHFGNGEVGFFSFNAEVRAGATDVWLILRASLARFDRQTGQRKADIKLPRPVLQVRHDANSLVALSAPDETRRVITRVSFANGSVQTEEVKLASAAPVKKRRWLKGLAPEVAAAPPAEDSPDELLMADPTVVQMKVKMLEEKFAAYEAMAPKKGPTKIESGTLTSGQSVAAALEQVNEITRYSTGGMAQEDQSRYEVTLHRWLAKDAPDWSGEIIGPPAFHSLKTVDVVTGVRSVTVIDKANKKLWESKLTHPFVSGSSYSSGFDGDDPERRTPFVEHGGDLYVIDAGMLTRFNLKTGEAKWRLTSVGISKVLFDDTGQIYLVSTTASPDTIQHWQDSDFANRPKPVILKVDAATGRQLWQVDAIADKITLSGKYLYASRTKMDNFAMLDSRSEPEMHFNLYRIDPSSGGTLWRHYENRAPLRMDFEGREIMLHFRDELKVLRYFAL